MYNLHVECGYALFVINLMELEMMIYYSLFTSHRNNLFVLVLLVGLLFAKNWDILFGIRINSVFSRNGQTKLKLPICLAEKKHELTWSN